MNYAIWNKVSYRGVRDKLTDQTLLNKIKTSWKATSKEIRKSISAWKKHLFWKLEVTWINPFILLSIVCTSFLICQYSYNLQITFFSYYFDLYFITAHGIVWAYFCISYYTSFVLKGTHCRKGLSIKDVRRQGVVQCGQGGRVLHMRTSAHFCAENFGFFKIYGVSAWTREGVE